MSLRAKRSGTAGIVLCAIVAVGVLGYLATRQTSAQEAGADLGDALAKRMATQVVTLRVDSAKGEPRAVSGVARFDRRVEGYWINVVGVDMQFTRNVEKQINRQMFKVDPIAKVVNGKDLEISGMLGMRDGSGDWDDNYEGTITVCVTAVMGNP